MKKIYLIVILFLVLVNVVFARTIKLNNFDQLLKELNNGEIVRVVVHYGNCKLISGNEEKTSPDAIGGMYIGTYEYFAPMSIGNPKGFLAFSHTNLINYGGFIYNYVKFKIYDDNTVKITAQYANPGDFSLEMNENFFSEINNGKNKGAVYFYKQE